MSDFNPYRLFRGGFVQTLASHYFPQKEHKHFDKKHLVELGDGDKLILLENKPKELKTQTIVLIIHGLTGDSQSNYMKRLALQFNQLGHRVMRMNLRGAGEGLHLAKSPYHSGRSEDLRATLRFIKKLYPMSPIKIIGFSLGGNIVLKTLGEGRELENVEKAAVVSAPLELEPTALKLGKNPSRVFEQYFLKNIREEVKKKIEHFPELKHFYPGKVKSIYQLDDEYTAPLSGFQSALDYYTQSSSMQYLEGIEVPTLVIFAMDDPIIHTDSYLKAPKVKSLSYSIHKTGGHVGFFDPRIVDPYRRWSDKKIKDFFKN
jgi:predicted alpha/beta-fold hydrolase